MWNKWTTFFLIYNIICLYNMFIFWCQVLQVCVVKCKCGHEPQGDTSPLSSLPPLGKSELSQWHIWVTNFRRWKRPLFYAKEEPWFFICPQEGSRYMEITLDCGDCCCIEEERRRQWRVSLFSLCSLLNCRYLLWLHSKYRDLAKFHFFLLGMWKLHDVK